MPPVIGGRPRDSMDMSMSMNVSTGTSFNMLFSPAASSLASTPGGAAAAAAAVPSLEREEGSHLLGGTGAVELELNWEPPRVKAELMQATAILNHRGLKLAAKWTSEQMVGIATDGPPHPTNGTASAAFMDQAASSNGRAMEWDATSFQHELSAMTPQDWYAKSLLDVGEYLHAASILSQPSPSGKSGDIMQLEGPLGNLSSFGTYVRAYALYLAGERRKEEDHLELQSTPQKQKASRNPYLTKLVEELETAYQNDKLDTFGLYVYGMVLKEAQKETLTCPRPPHTALIESLKAFPCNWSAWLDLAEILSSSDTAMEQQVEQALQSTLATHYMYHFFCAHLMANHHQAHEDALVLYDRLYEPLPDQPLFTTSYLKTQMGVVHYHLREFEQALEWFHQIQDPFLLENKDIYSNILYVKEDRVALSQLAHQVVRIDKYRPETCCIIGNYYSLKQQRQKAVLYFQRALQLDRSYTSAWTLMGHEYVELKQTESAMEAYRRAVNVSPKDYRAWYGLGQTYEFLNMHLYALFYYRKAAMLRPYDARMWCAVGLCLVALFKIPDAIRAYERAVAQDDTEGIATQKLATLYRQEGRTEEAAQCYLRHLELRYMVTNPHPPSSTPNQTTLDDIVQGIVVDAPEAEAFVFLAHYHNRNGEFDTAALLCSKLVDYPGPEKEEAKGLLRDLRSRGRRGGGGGGGGGGDNATETPRNVATPPPTGSGGNDDGDNRTAAPASPFVFSP